MKSKFPHALALSLLAGCSATPEQRVKGLPDTGSPALHAVNDARLRELMDRMNSLMFERFMTEQDLDKERRRQTRQIAAAAADLHQAVDGLLARLPALRLSEAERVAFRALAEKLRAQAGELKARAEANQVDALPADLERMSYTCNACHLLFREPPDS
jgi:hypothetical protein